MAPYTSKGSYIIGGAASSGQLHQSYSPQECPPPCPACGGLQCFCRPRFFPGQLLTDEDLTRLEHYTVEKNRLHNRYLHGHGIVCGLDVTCNPCDPKSLVVKTGYALSPCGDDIVVCKDTSVDVCDLINQCRPASRTECDPMDPPGVEPCIEGGQDWILAICYDEKPSRGITALRADLGTYSGGKCTCGGSSALGCGCQTAHHGSTQQQKMAIPSQGRRTPAPCEPTLTCETYRFMVYRPSGKRDHPATGDGPVKQKAKALFERIGEAPTEKDSPEMWLAYMHRYRQVVWELLSEEPCFSPEDKEALSKISTPDIKLYTRDNDHQTYFLEARRYIGTVSVPLIRYLLTLFCRSFKPACQPPVERNCIPLARIRIRKEDCRVLSICEIEVREHALSALLENFYSAVRPYLSKVLGVICCDWMKGPSYEIKGEMIARKMTGFGHSARTKTNGVLNGQGVEAYEAARLLENAFANPEREVSMETVVLGLLGAQDANGKPFAAPEELGNPASFLLANQLLRPEIQKMLPESWSSALALISKIGVGAITDPTKNEPSRYEKEVAELKQMVERLEEKTTKQQKIITELQKRVKTKPA